MKSSDTSEHAIRAAGVDWAARWRELVEGREARAAAPTTPGGSRWDARAARFARLTQELDADRDPLVAALREALRPGDTLLDAGAGAGRYTIPLAASTRRVTAVEPSSGMRDSLADAVAARGLSNVMIVPGAWQDAEVPPHDVVLCSHVLYFVPDVVPFIEKLDRHALRACYIYLRVDARDKPLFPLWHEVHGVERAPEAGFVDLYNLLFSIGIRAHARLAPLERGPRYQDLDDAVEQTREALGLAPNDHQYDGRIQAFLTERLEPDGSQLAFPPYLQTAIVWWEKG